MLKELSGLERRKKFTDYDYVRNLVIEFLTDDEGNLFDLLYSEYGKMARRIGRIYGIANDYLSLRVLATTLCVVHRQEIRKRDFALYVRQILEQEAA